MQAKSSRATAREDLAASYLKQPTLKRGVSDLHHDQYSLPFSCLTGVESVVAAESSKSGEEFDVVRL